MERIPILKMGDLLLVTIQVDMHDRLALALQEDLTERIVKARARGVLIDENERFSVLGVITSQVGLIPLHQALIRYRAALARRCNRRAGGSFAGLRDARTCDGEQNPHRYGNRCLALKHGQAPQ